MYPTHPDALLTINDAIAYYGLDRRTKDRLRQLLHGKQLRRRYANENVYRRSDIEAALAQPRQRHPRGPHQIELRWCPLCGAPMPVRSILDRCAACCRRAA